MSESSWIGSFAKAVVVIGISAAISYKMYLMHQQIEELETKKKQLDQKNEDL